MAKSDSTSSRRVDTHGLTHIALAHRIPHLLGGDEHAVEIEGDGLDHTLWYVLSR